MKKKLKKLLNLLLITFVVMYQNYCTRNQDPISSYTLYYSFRSYYIHHIKAQTNNERMEKNEDASLKRIIKINSKRS